VRRLVKSDQYDSRIRPGFPNGITNITVGFSVLTIEDLQIEDMVSILVFNGGAIERTREAFPQVLSRIEILIQPNPKRKW